LKILDTGFRRYDRKDHVLTFYESISVHRVMKILARIQKEKRVLGPGESQLGNLVGTAKGSHGVTIDGHVLDRF